MPEEDESAAQVEEAQEILGVIFPTHDQTAKVVEPGKHAFHFPAPAKPPQAPTVLSPALGPASLPMRRNHLRCELGHHFRIELVTVVSLVADQPLGHIRHKTLLHRLRHQLHFSRRSTGCAHGERKTMAVGHTHDLGAFAAFGRPDLTPPFFAGTNVPSMKHSRRSKPPRSLRSCAMAKSTCSITPERTQFWKRRCTV